MLLASLILSFSLGLPAQDAHAGHSHDGSDPYGVFLDHTAPSICTVTFILGMRGEVGRAVSMTATGVLVSDDGLIMLSSSGIDAARRRLQPRRGRDGGEGMQIQSTPEELRVMLDGGTDEHEAELIAQDDTLGLVFVRVLDPSVLATTNPISFSTPEQMRVGEDLIGVNRLSKAYDSAPVLGWTRVTGRITQPRTMWAIGPGFSAGGLPLFNRYGQAVGVLSTQTPQSQDADTGRGGPDGGDRLFLIPATDVNAAIEQARQKMKANTKADAQPATQEGS